MDTSVKLCKVCKREMNLASFSAFTKKKVKGELVIYYSSYCRGCARALKAQKAQPQPCRPAIRRIGKVNPNGTLVWHDGEKLDGSPWLPAWMNNQKEGKP